MLDSDTVQCTWPVSHLGGRNSSSISVLAEVVPETRPMGITGDPALARSRLGELEVLPATATAGHPAEAF